jgi:hypothetical protein
MPLVKAIKTYFSRPYFQLFLLTRLPYLGRDSINPDAVNWHYRSEQFVVGLKYQQWDKTYQHYHPGVSLMWVMGSAIEIARQINPSLRVYTHENFLFLHTVAKYSVVFVQLGLSLGLIWVLSKIMKFPRAFLLVAFFSLEPFFIGNSRMLHMDVLLTLLLMTGLSLAYLVVNPNKNSRQKFYALFSGIFIGLSFLTKSIAIGGVPFILAFFIYSFWKEPKKLFLFLALFLGGFVSTVFLIFPAMWVSPIEVITNIFTEADRIGIRKGHEQIFFGQFSLDPGFLFYPVLIFLKTSPILFIGLILYIGSILQKKGVFLAIKAKAQNFLRMILREKGKFPVIKAKAQNLVRILLPLPINFSTYLSIFYLGYMVVMTISSKKIDRYLILIFPWLTLLAVMGYEKISSERVKKWIIPTGFTVLLALNFSFYPFQFTYTTLFVGSTKNAYSIVAQKPFGVGIPDLRDLILEKYGDFPSLAFYDAKPMSMIYVSSRIFDIEEVSPGDYDIVILGPNEEMPSKVLESSFRFKLDEVMKINGLDYWRIYVKEGFLSK